MEWHPHDASPLTPEELTAYIGPRADSYRAVFERFSRTAPPRFAFSWNWMAFFAGVWWYFYRKMYLWAVIDFAVSVIFGWTFFVPILWAIARAVTGNYLYYRQADRRIREFRPHGAPATAPADPASLGRLSLVGGVHRWIPWVAVVGIILLAVLSALFFGLVWEMIPPIQEHWPSPPGRWA